MKVIVLDTETTGLNQEKGARIIEIGLLEYDLEAKTLVDAWVQRIDPECPIEPQAQAVHGIAYEELVGCPTWADVAAEIAERMGRVNLLVAHNKGFDGPFIAGELNRVGIEVPPTESFCTMENARWACPDGKLPRLGELCFALGVEYDKAKAHAARYDIERTAECFFRGLDRGFYKLPEPRVVLEPRSTMETFKNCHDAPLVAA